MRGRAPIKRGKRDPPLWEKTISNPKKKNDAPARDLVLVTLIAIIETLG